MTLVPFPRATLVALLLVGVRLRGRVCVGPGVCGRLVRLVGEGPLPHLCMVLLVGGGPSLRARFDLWVRGRRVLRALVVLGVALCWGAGSARIWRHWWRASLICLLLSAL